MISCKTATQIIVKKELKKATFKERFDLFVHLLLCEVCRLFEQQSKKIDELIAKKFSKNVQMRDSKKREIEEKLKDNE